MVDDEGELRMATLPLDVEGVLGEMPGRADEGMPEATTMGHVHLQVRDIPEAEAFWSGSSASSRRCAATPGRSSSRPAATTTTSG